ncbi:MAG: ferritin [Actinomycetota bacterium]|nr:ferritin [Actinomycetota bacterium]MDH5225296.1 ferritin [Actinomycetota bacterium]
MLSPDLETRLNEQMRSEFSSAHLYLQMAAHFETSGFPGFSAWMRAQADEERAHAMRFFDFILDRGGTAVLGAVEAPPAEFGSPLEVFEASLAHERTITTAIDGLYEGADRATSAFLDWFATEQVEEEATVSQIVESLKLAGQSGPALLIMDRDLGSRSTAPDPGA